MTLRLEGVVKRYGSVRALDGVDLDVPAGRYVCVLGPSGCGKTTLLRAIGGFEQPDGGRVLLDGADQGLLRPDQRPVNTVFQSYALFPHLDVLDNVAFGPRRRGIGRREARALAAQALDVVELADLARRRPHQLSGGQAQRVALARALVNDPAVLLLDEPLGALDASLRQAMQSQLRAVQRRAGSTFVHVTHDQEEAMAVADEVVVLRGGRVEQRGAPEALYDLPATAFVARFLGGAALLPGRVESPGVLTSGRVSSGRVPSLSPMLAVEVGGRAVQVPADRARLGSDSATVWVGIRRERIAVRVPGADAAGVSAAAGAARAGGLNVLAGGVVAQVSYVGGARRLLVEVPGLDPVPVLMPEAGHAREGWGAGEGREWRPGDRVDLAFAVADTFAVPREPS